MLSSPHLVAGLDFGLLPQQVVNGILLGSIYALIALGYTMVYGVLRLINFAHGEVFMLGAYTALLVSWQLGFSPADLAANPTRGGSIAILLTMMLASMAACGIIGVVIERFAYRPMRHQQRIAVLITAIGVSLLLQFGGALFLPNSPPPSISERVNPYAGATSFDLRPLPDEQRTELERARSTAAAATARFQERFAFEQRELGTTTEFDLTPEGQVLRRERIDAEGKVRDLQSKANVASARISIPNGQLMMFITTIVLMLLLRQLVMKTSVGRAMRAVSHDFDSASLMGINVGAIITLTFLIGSSLAGAGAMMNATFMGTPLTTFFGLLPGVKAFVAAVLGGIGNIPGAVLGGFLMGMAETMVVWVGYSSFRDAIAFVILIAVLLFRPGGLLGSAKMEKV